MKEKIALSMLLCKYKCASPAEMSHWAKCKWQCSECLMSETDSVS